MVRYTTRLSLLDLVRLDERQLQPKQANEDQQVLAAYEDDARQAEARVVVDELMRRRWS